jgi:ubiquinol-cytochrome c reductase cytochrome c1 subunit
LQGVREPQFQTISSHGNDAQVFKGWTQLTPGTMTPLEFDQSIADLVAYLQWMGEPAQNTRVRIGVWVLLFLGLFSFVAWRLNASFWKNVK